MLVSRKSGQPASAQAYAYAGMMFLYSVLQVQRVLAGTGSHGNNCFTHLQGDGECNSHNNHHDCSWDGGDCCQSTCLVHAGAEEPALCGPYHCHDPTAEQKCSSPASWLGDGFCDLDANIDVCNWDSGDCCALTCGAAATEAGTDVSYQCGSAGYDCQDENGQVEDWAPCESQDDCDSASQFCAFYSHALGNRCFTCDYIDFCPIYRAEDVSCDAVCKVVLDCEGNDATDYMHWIGDSYCDDGSYGLVLNCDIFKCDGGDCECDREELVDCSGATFSSEIWSWVGDGICDDGSFGVFLDCDAFECDSGDCDCGCSPAACSLEDKSDDSDASQCNFPFTYNDLDFYACTDAYSDEGTACFVDDEDDGAWVACDSSSCTSTCQIASMQFTVASETENASISVRGISDASLATEAIEAGYNNTVELSVRQDLLLVSSTAAETVDIWVDVVICGKWERSAYQRVCLPAPAPAPMQLEEDSVTVQLKQINLVLDEDNSVEDEEDCQSQCWGYSFAATELVHGSYTCMCYEACDSEHSATITASASHYVLDYFAPFTSPVEFGLNTNSSIPTGGDESDTCSCEATCDGYSCDDWVAIGFTCDYLEEDLGCSCHSCTCAKDTGETLLCESSDECVMPGHYCSAYESNGEEHQECYPCIDSAGRDCEWWDDSVDDCSACDACVDCDGFPCAHMETSWVGDGVCDDGRYGRDFSCATFNYDGGDCVLENSTTPGSTRSGIASTVRHINATAVLSVTDLPLTTLASSNATTPSTTSIASTDHLDVHTTQRFGISRPPSSFVTTQGRTGGQDALVPNTTRATNLDITRIQSTPKKPVAASEGNLTPSFSTTMADALPASIAPRTNESTCDDTCYGQSCDYWGFAMPGYTCNSMESDYGCDCSGCDCNFSPDCAVTCYQQTCDYWVVLMQLHTCTQLEDNFDCDCSNCNCNENIDELVTSNPPSTSRLVISPAMSSDDALPDDVTFFLSNLTAEILNEVMNEVKNNCNITLIPGELSKFSLDGSLGLLSSDGSAYAEAALLAGNSENQTLLSFSDFCSVLCSVEDSCHYYIVHDDITSTSYCSIRESTLVLDRPSGDDGGSESRESGDVDISDSSSTTAQFQIYCTDQGHFSSSSTKQATTNPVKNGGTSLASTIDITQSTPRHEVLASSVTGISIHEDLASSVFTPAVVNVTSSGNQLIAVMDDRLADITDAASGASLNPTDDASLAEKVWYEQTQIVIPISGIILLSVVVPIVAVIAIRRRRAMQKRHNGKSLPQEVQNTEASTDYKQRSALTITTSSNFDYGTTLGCEGTSADNSVPRCRTITPRGRLGRRKGKRRRRRKKHRRNGSEGVNDTTQNSDCNDCGQWSGSGSFENSSEARSSFEDRSSLDNNVNALCMDMGDPQEELPKTVQSSRQDIAIQRPPSRRPNMTKRGRVRHVTSASRHNKAETEKMPQTWVTSCDKASGLVQTMRWADSTGSDDNSDTSGESDLIVRLHAPGDRGSNVNDVDLHNTKRSSGLDHVFSVPMQSTSGLTKAAGRSGGAARLKKAMAEARRKAGLTTSITSRHGDDRDTISRESKHAQRSNSSNSDAKGHATRPSRARWAVSLAENMRRVRRAASGGWADIKEFTGSDSAAPGSFDYV